MNVRRSLRGRVIAAFVLFAAIVSVLYGAHAFLFAYVVEDELFERIIEDEAVRIRSALAAGREPRPSVPFVRYVADADDLPTEVRAAFAGDPRTSEVYGRGEAHYHVRRLAPQRGWMVANVGPQLVVRRMRGTLFLLLAVSGAVVVLVATALGAWLARRSVAPLTQLVGAVGRIDPDELPRTLVLESSDAEVGALGAALQASFDRIRRFVERETHFTREVSHELRTPLTIIGNSAELLEQQPLDAAGRAQLGRIREAARDAAMTVDALLALAREESAHEPPASVALLPLVEKLVIRHAALLTNKPVEVELDVAPDLRIAAAPAALEIVVSNLLANAFRYTSAGVVLVAAESAQITVSDSGPGIPEEVRSSATEPLVRGANSVGHGIGLSLVKRVCEHHRWTMTLRTSPDGTEVRVAFGEAAGARR